LNSTLGINSLPPSETPPESENTPPALVTLTVEELQLFLESLSSKQNDGEARQQINFASSYNIMLGQQTPELETDVIHDQLLAREVTNQYLQTNEEPLTQQTTNLTGIRTNNIINNIIVTPVRTPNDETGETENSLVSYKPKNTRLLPVRVALASQPKAVRPILEKLCSTVFSNTKVIYDRARAVDLWDDRLVNRVNDNIANNLDNLDHDSTFQKT